MKFKGILKRKKIIIAVIILCTFIAIFFTTFTIKIVKKAQLSKMEQVPLLTYDIAEENEDTGVFKILVKITSIDGIETIKYKDSNNGEEITLFCKRKKYSRNRLFCKGI